MHLDCAYCYYAPSRLFIPSQKSNFMPVNSTNARIVPCRGMTTPRLWSRLIIGIYIRRPVDRVNRTASNIALTSNLTLASVGEVLSAVSFTGLTVINNSTRRVNATMTMSRTIRRTISTKVDVNRSIGISFD